MMTHIEKNNLYDKIKNMNEKQFNEFIEKLDKTKDFKIIELLYNTKRKN